MRFCPRCGSRYEHERFCPEDGAPTEVLPEAGPPRDALLGTTIDQRYRIEAQIGEGGMGVVYKATHVALNKAVALKILRGDMAREPEVVQRFMQEAQSASGIGHENIIDIHDFGRLPDGTAYFVMEYLDGRALKEMIERGGSIPTGDAVRILRQIASALGAAHERGIVHRDLKPDNVVVIQRGELTHFVKVLDFGIAKVGASKNKLTRTGMVFGTPHYMSPEQAAGQAVDLRTDIYALGVIMYEMFTGRVPFEADTFMGVLTKHMFEKPAPFNAQAERQLGALEQITMRALEKKPENRYPTMAALIEDLDNVMGGGRPRQVEGAHPSREIADALEPRSKSELRIERELSAAEDGAPELPGRKRMPLYLAAGALVLAAILLGVFMPDREEPAAEAAEPAAISTPPVLPDTQPASSELPSGKELLINVRSTPPGAEIFDGDALLGHTPAQMPPPAQGQRMLTLRLDGYRDADVVLRPDGPTTLEVALAAQEPPRPESAATPAPAPKPASRRTRAPTSSPSKPRSRRASEVIDPWGE